ncbi:MAG TPA: hypothetical protein VF666_06875 [Pyrinomonadaceae bacterium]|jgi:hypothetical protein
MKQYPKQIGSTTRILLTAFVLATFTSSAFAVQKKGSAAPTQPKTAPAEQKTEQKRDETAVETGEPDGAKKAWNLKVSEGAPQTFTLRATKASLAQITAELGRQLKVPVYVSPLMEKQRVTLELNGMPLDAVLRSLAPQSYIDYELGGDNYLPKPLALYLYGANEAAPALNTIVKNTTQSLLVEGDTEEGTEEYEKRQAQEENPLHVTFTNKQLSVRARKQPLSVVLYKIASELGIPFDMRSDSNEIVDVNFSNYSVDQAVRTISPSVRFYFRTDLQTFEIQPLRLALVAQPRS